MLFENRSSILVLPKAPGVAVGVHRRLALGPDLANAVWEQPIRIGLPDCSSPVQFIQAGERQLEQVRREVIDLMTNIPAEYEIAVNFVFPIPKIPPVDATA
jgi:hypothetical protein